MAISDSLSLYRDELFDRDRGSTASSRFLVGYLRQGEPV
jgi:hypothetical protein